MAYTFKIELDKLNDEYETHTRVKSSYLARYKHPKFQKSVSTGSDLRGRDAKLLYANNGYARTEFAKLIFEEMELLSLKREGRSFIQLTLTPRQYTLGENSTKFFDPSQFKRLISRYFGTVNMLGMIEPGFYPRVANGMGSKGTVSFHLHAIVWDISPVALREIAMAFKQRHKSFNIQKPSAYVQVVPAGDLPHLLWYHHKPASHGYDPNKPVIEAIEEDSGEIVCWLDPQSKAWRRRLRPGERIRLDNAISHLMVDQLLVVTGTEGKAMGKRIKSAALAEFERSAARGRKR